MIFPKKKERLRNNNDNDKTPGDKFHTWCHPSHYTIFEHICDEHTTKSKNEPLCETCIFIL